MRVTVRLFGRLRELAGTGELDREADAGATVRQVWQALARDFPAVAPYATSISSAVNADYVRMDATVKDGDEVAFLPPVSGGS
jgi:molybdopterin converting factor subunit 1